MSFSFSAGRVNKSKQLFWLDKINYICVESRYCKEREKETMRFSENDKVSIFELQHLKKFTPVIVNITEHLKLCHYGPNLQTWIPHTPIHLLHHMHRWFQALRRNIKQENYARSHDREFR